MYFDVCQKHYPMKWHTSQCLTKEPHAHTHTLLPSHESRIYIYTVHTRRCNHKHQNRNTHIYIYKHFMHFQSKQKQNNPSRFLNSNCPGERIWNHNWSGISFCHVVITNGLGITFLVLHKPAPPICWINIHLMYGFAIHVCQLTSQNKVDHYIEITIICRGALKVMGICYLPETNIQKTPWK